MLLKRLTDGAAALQGSGGHLYRGLKKVANNDREGPDNDAGHDSDHGAGKHHHESRHTG